MQMVFQVAYAVSMLLMGRLMDGLGLRWGFVFACAFWGLASMSHAFAPEIGSLFGSAITGFFICRILLGLGEGGNFPAAIKTTAEWFPKRERALATGLFNSGSNVGGLLVPWALPFVVLQFSALTIGGVTVGWRGAFIITAVIDLCWIIAWLAFYKKPEEHPRVSRAELALIQSDAAEPTAKIAWRKLLPHRQMWAFAAVKFMTDCFWWFYLFGSPDFFNKKFHLDPAGRKYMIMMIYVVASAGSIAGGWLAGYFMRKGWTVNKSRKITMLICATLVVPVVYAAITTDKWVAAVLITIAASAHQAWSANVFSLAGDMFPKRVVGSVTGLGGMIGAGGGIALFYITGKVLRETGNYLPVFVLASLAYITALVIVHLIVPRLEAANIEEKAPA
jgi:ACS family hexuronate transporter-like MFS transporter